MSKLDLNFVNRYTKLSYDSSTSANKVRASNRKLIYSRYKPCKVFKSVGKDVFWSCAFTPDDQCLLAGTEDGEVHIYNKYSNALIQKKKVHRFVTSLVPHKTGELLLTSGYNSYPRHKSALWNIKNDFENQFMLNDCLHAKFTHDQDKVLGTSGSTAKLYDLNSGQVIHEYKPKTQPSFKLYIDNKAVMNPSEKLLLTDRVMFDVRSGKEVHRFKQMNCFMNGTFHINRLEILSSSQIWDLRMFHLLQTLEKLKFCNVEFNNCGDVIYGFYLYEYYGEDLKVFDATDYSSIATIEGHRMVSSFAVNPTDTQIAVTTKVQLEGRSVVGVHLYDIGMVRHEEEVDA